MLKQLLKVLSHSWGDKNRYLHASDTRIIIYIRSRYDDADAHIVGSVHGARYSARIHLDSQVADAVIKNHQTLLH